MRCLGWHNQYISLRSKMPRNVSFIDETQIDVHLYGLSICNASNYIEAISGLIAAYWAYDTAFDPHLVKTLGFMARYATNLSQYNVTPPVQRLLNKFIVTINYRYHFL